MRAALIHDYGELKLLQLLDAWRCLRNDRDVCWTINAYFNEMKEINEEYMDESYKEMNNGENQITFGKEEEKNE